MKVLARGLAVGWMAHGLVPSFTTPSKGSSSVLARRILQVDDATSSACASSLETYYSCAGVVNATDDDASAAAAATTGTFCESLAILESTESCSVEDCSTEFEEAMTCYADSGCGETYDCAPTTSDPTATTVVATVAVYNANAAGSVCFEVGSTTKVDDWTSSGLVAYGETMYVDFDATSAVEPYDAFVRVLDSCDGGTVAAEGVFDVYSTDSNLVSWGISSRSDGYLQTLRVDDDDAATYLLNEYDDVTCHFTETNSSVDLHRAKVVDLGCGDLRDMDELTVVCDGESASLEVVPGDICDDVSRHFVAAKSAAGNLELHLFQGTDSCLRTCAKSGSSSSKSSKGLDDGALIAIIVIVVIVVVVLALVLSKLCKSSNTPDAAEHNRMVDLDEQSTPVSNQIQQSEPLELHNKL